MKRHTVALLFLALFAAFAASGCATQADRAKTGLDQAGNELGSAGKDAEKGADYATDDAKKEAKGEKK